MHCKWFVVRKAKEAKMRSIKLSKIAAIWLLVMSLVCISKASQQGMSRKSADVELRLSTSPKLNEVFTVRAKIIGRKGLEEDAYFFSTYEFRVVFSTHPEGAIKIIDKSEGYIPELRNGWTKEVECRMQIVKPLTNINILCRLYPLSHGVTQVADVIELYLLDSLTGQYGTREEYEGRLPAEYWYDPLVGTFTCSPSQNPAPVEENRQIIKMIKNLEPALSDSEALLLHSEQYKVGVPKGVVKWDSAGQRWTEERMFEYYLKDGWLKALRENRLEEWRKQEKQKILSEHKEQKSQFFRGDSDNIANNRGSVFDSTQTRWSYVYFKGQFRYKKHQYNKDQGII